MKNLKVFTIAAVMALISLSMFVSCQKENVNQNEESSINLQKSMKHFVLMTEEERYYLRESGISLTIDEFTPLAWSIVNAFTTVADRIFVASVGNDRVYFAGISATGNNASWYIRIHEHLKIVKNDPTFPFYPYDPSVMDELPVKCIYTDDENKILAWVLLEVLRGTNFKVEYDKDTKYWFGCNGTCCPPKK